MISNENVVSLSSPQNVVASVEQLIAATRFTGARRIVVRGHIANVPSFRLAPGQSLEGEDEAAAIDFAPGGDGVQLSSDNEVRGIELHTTPERRAIFNDTAVVGLGRIRLAEVATTGQVQILARDAVRSGHVDVQGLDIVAADTRTQHERPNGFGVDVLQGAFTLWNMQPDENVVISARLMGLSAGRDGAPVLGSGVFVGGAGAKGGRVVATVVETAAVYSHGKIPAGTADQITGGVFMLHGAHVDVVRNLGPVVTYGVNDMVLDNWGFVDRWVAMDKLTSYGPSAIGFVNFGTLNHLKVERTIETFGLGARGFNIYAGTLALAEFDRIVTHADGAVGIQISRPIGTLKVRRGVETYGGTGRSLIEGKAVTLSALGLSVRLGGAADAIEIDGGIRTHGLGVAPIELHGEVGLLQVDGGIAGAGGGSDAI